MRRSWLVVASLLGSLAHATEPQAFLNSYCITCHGAEKQKADRRYDDLALPASTAQHVTDLQDILDQLNLGDMPPKKAKQPSAEERAQMIQQLTTALCEARKKQQSTAGQTVLRRLNRREYLNTIGDLFALDVRLFDPTQKFPKDQLAEHQDNLGDALQTSSYLLESYLQAADLVVEKALGETQKPEVIERQFHAPFSAQQEHKYPHEKVYGSKYLCVYEVPDTTSHEGGYVYLHEFRQGVPADGTYEIEVKVQAMHREHPYDPAIFGRDTRQQFRMGIVPGDVTAGPLNHPQPIQPQLAEVTVPDGEPQWYTLRVPLYRGQTPRFIFPNGMADSRKAFLKVIKQYGGAWPGVDPKTIGIFLGRAAVLKHGQFPHLRIHEVKVRGPLLDTWPPPSQRAVLGDQAFREPDTRSLLQAFAIKAYRRPVSEEEVDHLMQVVQARKESGKDAFAAFKDGLKAMLCSPAFLYHSEAVGKEKQLTAHAQATRLSYFLCSTAPDAELRGLADSGELLQPAVKQAQVKRLLASPRAKSFVQDFLNSWLNLRSLGDMPPDRDDFRQYYSQDLQGAMLQETQLFMQHLIAQDRSISEFLDSDYTFVNQALAEHYQLGEQLPPERASEFIQVSLKDKRRGGLLGQGSVLTVSANGIETSPVRRGVWLLENILGTPTPPAPDDVPVIDPDVRGAKSIREVLVKHRESAACLECHQKIDPPGFALENFDPIGGWREFYPQERKKGPKIDPSGEMPSGEKIQGIQDLKRILLARKESFARHLTQRLLSYACGRRVEDSDRAEVDAILSKIAEKDDGLRSLIEQVVLSGMFVRG